jgi:hypothetical protein
LAARAVETFLPDPKRPLRKPADPADGDHTDDATIAAGVH